MSDDQDRESADIIRMVPKPTEAERAAEIKRRLTDAMAPVMAIFDEAAQAGLMVQWDSISPVAPMWRHQVVNLRIIKTY